MEKLLSILRDMKPEVDFTNVDELIESGILDSFDVIDLSERICSEFSIEIDPEDILIENFDHIDNIRNLIRKYSREVC